MSNSTVEQAVADIIIAATRTAGEAKDFVLAELPDVVQQLLLWKAAYNLLWFVILLSVSWVCYLAFRRLDAWIKEPLVRTDKQNERLEKLRAMGYVKRTYDEDMEFKELAKSNRLDNNGAQYMFLVPVPFLLVGAFSNCLDWLQIWIAPDVYLIEYAAQLVGG